MTCDAFYIRAIMPQDIENVQKFLLEQCRALYGGQISANQYRDLEQLHANYVAPPRHTLLGAFGDEGRLAGTIAISAYNNRIACIKDRYAHGEAAEVGRCYIDESLRRCGLGSRLFEAARSFAAEAGFVSLYLHTHYFLPGGFSFWRKKGFEILVDEKDAHQTVHMERPVGDATDA